MPTVAEIFCSASTRFVWALDKAKRLLDCPSVVAGEAALTLRVVVAVNCQQVFLRLLQGWRVLSISLITAASSVPKNSISAVFAANISS